MDHCIPIQIHMMIVGVHGTSDSYQLSDIKIPAGKNLLELVMDTGRSSTVFGRSVAPSRIFAQLCTCIWICG